MIKSSQPVLQEVVQKVAEYFSILSEPMRLGILNLHRDGEKCVQEFVEATQRNQANVSRHIKLMLQAGILARRSAGTSAYDNRVQDE
ncbi:metalloregulator ArsR/SmtB family transcription factor [Microcoleus sp. LEGE 07076]|uniref:ArsR/SmtB family transcription factor n=1 Tax=Microcoleus sp. LEGE 07076 TaxID=915322 RepID=UPI0030DD4760